MRHTRSASQSSAGPRVTSARHPARPIVHQPTVGGWLIQSSAADPFAVIGVIGGQPIARNWKLLVDELAGVELVQVQFVGGLLGGLDGAFALPAGLAGLFDGQFGEELFVFVDPGLQSLLGFGSQFADIARL